MTTIYSSLPATEGSIRLLSISPSQDSTNVRSELSIGNIYTSEFRALSYVWGPPSPTYSIHVNDEVIQIRQSLYNFLRRYHNLDLGPIWIDALCINQNDVTERNQQVQQMAQLYRNASEVIVWLEDAATDVNFFSNFDSEGGWCGEVAPKISHTSDADLQANISESGDQAMHDRFVQLQMHSWQDWSEEEQSMSLSGLTDDMDQLEEWTDFDRQKALQLFDEISTHDYWTRAWVVQEFRLAKTLRFWFTNHEITLRQFETAFGLTEPYEENASDASKRLSELLYSRDNDINVVTEESRAIFPDNLFELLERFGQRNCADARDRIYALLGMSAEAKQLEVDYRLEKPQLFIRALRAMREPRFRASLLLFEALEISVDDILSATLPQVTFSYPSAGGHFVLNGTGSRSKTEIRTCCCKHCLNLTELLQLNDQHIVVKVASTVMYLIYSRTHCSTDGENTIREELNFTACATSENTDRRWIYAYMANGELQSLFHRSKLVMVQGAKIPKIVLDEKSILAYTYLASRQCDETILAHETLAKPGPGQGLIGRLYHEIDWTR